MGIKDEFNDLAARTGFSPEQLTALTGGEPTAPRLQLLSDVVEGVSSAYTQEGLRRWFDRARSPLDGKSPAEVLRQPGWQPSDQGPQKVLQLAQWLLN